MNAGNESVEGLRTRKACILLGAAAFTGCLAVALLIPPFLEALPGAPRYHRATLLESLQALFVALPLAVLFGAVVGFEAYRLATGLREFLEIKWWTWLLSFFILTVCLPLFYFQYRRRRKILHESAAVGWLAPCVYALLVLGADYQGAVFEAEGKRMAFRILGALLSLLVADSLVVNVIAGWRNQRRLALPTAHRFQFSLGSLMLAVLGLGAWVSGLVLVFRD